MLDQLVAHIKLQALQHKQWRAAVRAVFPDGVIGDE